MSWIFPSIVNLCKGFKSLMYTNYLFQGWVGAFAFSQRTRLPKANSLKPILGLPCKISSCLSVHAGVHAPRSSHGLPARPGGDGKCFQHWETPTAFYACRGLINPPDESGGYCWVRPTAFGQIADMVCRLAVNPGVVVG